MGEGENNREIQPLRPAVPEPASEPASATASETTPETTSEADTVPDTTADGQAETTEPRAPGRRLRVPFAHAVRRVSIRRAVPLLLRRTRDWSRGPGGRVALPALLLFALIAASGTAGAVLVPAAADDDSQPPRPTPTGGQPLPDGLDLPATPPVGGPSTAPSGPPPTGGTPGRPADVLADWAQQVGSRAGIPPVAMQAYGYAELVLSRTKPGCRLTWTTLAAIGWVESRHGQANGNTLGPDGRSTPGIVGLPLNGEGGRQRIADTDSGQLDGDRVYDRAVGPMQFIPTTWRENAVDADNNGIRDPQDIDDAALAAGNYLCRGNRNLSVAQDWWDAIRSYNNVRSYIQNVFDTANRYGTASRG